MTALSLLADLGTIGVRVEADPSSPGDLVVRGPTRRLTPGLLDSIRDRKPELLGILAASPSWRPFAYSAPDEPAWISDPSLTVALADVRRAEDDAGPRPLPPTERLPSRDRITTAGPVALHRAMRPARLTTAKDIILYV